MRALLPDTVMMMRMIVFLAAARHSSDGGCRAFELLRDKAAAQRRYGARHAREGRFAPSASSSRRRTTAFYQRSS